MSLEIRILLSLFLGSLPIISFFLQKYFSKNSGGSKLFYKFIPSVYLDWLFVPFNLIWPFVVIFTNYLWLLFLIILVGNFVFSKIWINAHSLENKPVGLYDLKRKVFTPLGKIHSIYAQIQATLVFYFIIFSYQNIFSLICLFLFFIYICAVPFSSRSIHGKFIFADKVFMTICLIGVFIKLFLYFN